MNYTNTSQNSCPVCSSVDADSLYPNYDGKCITSDYAVLPHATIANRCCRGCGLVYNAGGTRGFTEKFYRNSYSLMLQRKSAAIQSFSGGAQVSQGERSFGIFQEMVRPSNEGRILEAGAGKGDFLISLSQAIPSWKISAFEPSAAFDVLKTRLPHANTMQGAFTDFMSLDGDFDVVAALGVLEHVENPLEMLRWGRSHLKMGGILFIRVPNFANNPNDLFCVDHLSKLTLPTLRALAFLAGFDVLAEREDGVPLYIALRKTHTRDTELKPNAFAENKMLAMRNMEIARKSIDAVSICRANAISKGERFGIFGLGSSGLFAPFFSNFSASEIEAYVDENQTVWGNEIHGRPVCGLDVIVERNIKHMALAISPVYIERVRNKLTPLGVEVYAADGH